MTEAGKAGWFSRIRRGLARSAGSLGQGISGVVVGRKLDRAALQELEDVLITADLGIAAASNVVEGLAAQKLGREVSESDLKATLAAEVERIVAPVARPLEVDRACKPFVVLVVGVNGTGKTTTIGKLAYLFAEDGMAVAIAAGDTFRAAAIDQLKVWGERAGARVYAKEVGADPAGLAFDALRAAKEASSDVLLIDTAGRLQNKVELMAELEKVVRVLRKQDDNAPHSVVLVLDATTGQNVHSQVELFQKACNVTGLVMTKLDGTARGGVLVAVASRFGLPIHAIGVGEGIEDLRPFDAASFSRALVGSEA